MATTRRALQLDDVTEGDPVTVSIRSFDGTMVVRKSGIYRGLCRQSDGSWRVLLLLPCGIVERIPTRLVVRLRVGGGR